VRLTGWRIDAFGALEDFAVSGLDDANVIVVVGPNESGKSTLREFLATALFGFAPASRDTHPYAPSAGRFGGALNLLDNAGERFSVDRELRSAPRGRLYRPETHEDLANRPAPGTDGLTRAVYLAVHSIGPDELLAIHTAAWRVIEERIVSGATTSLLRPVSDARRELDDQAAALWRADRRGQPLTRRLAGELADLRRAERVAAADSRRLVAVDGELAGIVATEAAQREELARIAIKRRRHELLGPALEAVRATGTLRDQARTLVAVDDFPRDPDEALAQRRGRVDETANAERDAHARVETLERRSTLSDDDRQLLAAANRIQLAASNERVLRERHAALQAAQTTLELRAARVRRLTDALLGRAATPADEAALAAVNPAQVRASLVLLDRALRPAAPRTAGGGVSGVLAAASAVFAGLAAVGIGGRIVPLIAAVVLAVAAAAARRTTTPPSVGSPVEAVTAALGGLAVDPSRLAAGDVSIAADIVDLHAAADESAAVGREVQRLRDAIDRAESERQSLLDAFGVVTIDAATELLDTATRTAAAACSAASELDRARREATHHSTAAAAARAALDGLESRLASVTPSGVLDDGVAVILEARRLRVAADERERAAIDRYGDLDGIVEEAAVLTRAGEAVALDQADLALLTVDEQNANERLGEARQRRGALEQERRPLAERPGAADLAGQIEAIEERVRDAQRGRDRLALASSVLRHAERTYRERYGPRYLKAASRYLELITGGRWVQIMIGEAASGATPRLEVVGVDSPVPCEVGPPLSRGTLEQIFVALRLALVDELDPQRQLPLFLDEALVHWDDERVGGLVPLLAAMTDRQVLVATCHPDLAERVAEATAAVVVSMPTTRRQQART
jgi:uncharacterized protein YhaN